MPTTVLFLPNIQNVTAHNLYRQISHIRETTSVSRKAPKGSELGDGVRFTTRAESEVLSSQTKTKKKILLLIYTYTVHCYGTERTSPGVHDKKPSYRVEEGEHTT